MALLVLASAVPTALRALLVLRVSTWACLLCFTTYTERVGICRMFAGVQEPRIAQCEEAFTAAFQGLSDMEINYEERSRLHDTFTQMTLSLQEEAVARGSFEVAFPAAAEKMKRAILQLKKVQPCIPPCGIQEASRRFHCRGCYSTVCDLPLDCPGRDGGSRRPGHVLLRRGLPAGRGGDRLLLELRGGRSPDPGRILLPRYATGPRVPGADSAGAAHAPRDLLLHDPARPAPPGAALLLPECDRPAPARGDRAAGPVPGSAPLGAAGCGNDRALEAQPGRVAGPARGPDAGQPGRAGRRHWPGIGRCNGAGVGILPMVFEW
ncbi:sperm acrosome membrane-associated protein 6 isoform X3 [Heterocephalus glaber]|uniref:Sperm acrosome membrane-associated protein 6 isoform X3 n=1 Tax=Heterocephalus glaber TaxID=10181 RepID=A0AAX6S092_HETGA|nr:sperm acrosome membrane-associated protein 6 isoform X3 [Heterocephalus glaber]